MHRDHAEGVAGLPASSVTLENTVGSSILQ
jgi:hypothetical protein